MNEVGVGSRVVNFLVDMVLISFMAYGLYKWYSFYSFYYNYRPYQYYVFFYLSIFLFNLLFEGVLNRTPGKYITMTRVRTLAGKRAGLHRVFVRSLVKTFPLDPFFMPIIGRPLHDALSGTRVVEMP